MLSYKKPLFIILQQTCLMSSLKGTNLYHVWMDLNNIKLKGLIVIKP